MGYAYWHGVPNRGMATIQVDDPEAYKEAEVNQSGQIYISKDRAGETVSLIIESFETDE